MSAHKVAVAVAACSHLGTKAQVVLRALLGPGKHTLQSLARIVSKSSSVRAASVSWICSAVCATPCVLMLQVKDALVTLMQHNIVAATEFEDGPVIYEASLDEALERIHFPK
jgi:hypothetical protein